MPSDYSEYELLSVEVDRRVAIATIAAPTIIVEPESEDEEGLEGEEGEEGEGVEGEEGESEDGDK